MKTAFDSPSLPQEKRTFRKKFFAGNRVCFFKAFWRTEPFNKEAVEKKSKNSQTGAS